LNVSFHTLGCKVNQFETEAMKQLFRENNYEIIHPGKTTDVFVVNSCTVTSASDRKTRNLINRYRMLNPDAVVVLTGCYPQSKRGDKEDYLSADIVIGTKKKNKIIEYLNDFLKTKKQMTYVDDFQDKEYYEEMSIQQMEDKTRANLKIQDGCRQFCSYCIIPYVRGPVRSRDIANVLREIKDLHANGYKEIVLNGIHITSYGKDLIETTLLDLIRSINELELKDIRYRLGSLEPGVINEGVLREMTKGSFCDHFHLSLQSGSDTVLKRMRRQYDTKEYLEKVNLIKKFMPEAGLTTDIIVGFPGEIEEEFKDTCDYVEKIGFQKVHVFSFSPRKGTSAYKMDQQISNKIKKARTNELISLTDRIAEETYKRQVGKIVDVIFEQEKTKGCYIGHTSSYLNASLMTSKNYQNKRCDVVVVESKNQTLFVEEVKK